MKIILDRRMLFFFFFFCFSLFFFFLSNIAPILPPLLEFTTQLRNIVVSELIRFSFTPGVRLVTMEHVWFREFNSYNSNLNTLFRITDGLVYFEICRVYKIMLKITWQKICLKNWSICLKIRLFHPRPGRIIFTRTVQYTSTIKSVIMINYNDRFDSVIFDITFKKWCVLNCVYYYKKLTVFTSSEHRIFAWLNDIHS